MRRGGFRGRSGSGAAGFSLVELVVALVVLQVGLLGVVGLSVLAADRVARAAELQRATGALEVVADSLLGSGATASGDRAVDGFLVTWTAAGTELRLEVLRDGGSGPVALEAVVPWVP